MQGVDGGQVLILGAVLGGDGAFLVKFAQVIEVIDPIADVFYAGVSFIGGRSQAAVTPESASSCALSASRRQ